MKKVLITGANSYIGTSFKKFIKDNFSDRFRVDPIDMIDGSWREKSFAGYDSVSLQRERSQIQKRIMGSQSCKLKRGSVV